MFSRKSAEAARPTTRPVREKTMASSTFSVIGADVIIRGDIQASADLHVDGRVEGDIACSSLVQGESSSITGQITAETARLAGHVNGSINARELIVLKTAQIEGDVHYDALTIEQGAQVEGRFAHRAPAHASSSAGEKADSDSDEPHLTLAG